jgi:Holliday junction resolvasome RuvABC endonuclease subunit
MNIVKETMTTPTSLPTTKFVGFDYSMTSPAMCITHDGTWQNSTTYFLTDRPKYTGIYGKHNEFQVIGEGHRIWTCAEQRFEQIAARFIEILSWSCGYNFNVTDYFIAIEDYSMGSKGKVFHIAENTGLLKYLLWKYKFNFITVAPTTIKKFATGKGNARKEQMYAQFKQESGLDLSKIMGQEGKLDSPVTDVVDAFYIAKYAKVFYEQNSFGLG